jgi:hypothetical protein
MIPCQNRSRQPVGAWVRDEPWRAIVTGRRRLAGRYEVGDLLGFGRLAIAEVRMGLDVFLGRKVVVKTPCAGLASDPGVREGFRWAACPPRR